MPGVGEQRDRVGEDAEHRLGGDEAEVEGDADDEGAPEIGRPVAVVVMVAEPGEPAAQAGAVVVAVIVTVGTVVVAAVVVRMPWP